MDLRADADLAAAPGALYLPLVQCSECHTTGWLSRVAPARSKVSTKRDEIYNTWFARRPEAVRLYPGRRLPRREVDGRDQHLCAACGNLQEPGEKCDACAHTELVPVFRTTGTRTSTRGNLAFTWHDTTCPTCGGRDRQLLVGARNATLGSQVVEQSWASGFNDDKKLDRVFRFRAGRRPSRGLLRRPHLRQHGADGAREGHRPSRDARASPGPASSPASIG